MMSVTRIFRLVLGCCVATSLVSCSPNKTAADANATSDIETIGRLEKKLNEYVAQKDARIGIAVIFNGRDTLSVNGEKEFPMQSVFKFPLALVIGNYLVANSLSLSDAVPVDFDMLIKDTYSPMLKKYGGGVRNITFGELLEWSLMESDNNAADILLNLIGGPAGMMSAMKEMGLPDDIEVGASEEDMHKDNYKSYLNRATPISMAELFDGFDLSIKNKSDIYMAISGMLEKCKTGLDRLPAPFLSGEAVVGHKTGTGFITTQGRLSSINDCGYVHLPNGDRYVIAVFVADSAYDIVETSKIIAEISEIVSEYEQ